MTSFKKDIRPLFRDLDVEHMNSYGLDLNSYQEVKDNAQEILERVSSSDDDSRMPPPPDPPWKPAWIQLFKQWISDGYPT